MDDHVRRRRIGDAPHAQVRLLEPRAAMRWITAPSKRCQPLRVSATEATRRSRAGKTDDADDGGLRPKCRPQDDAETSDQGGRETPATARPRPRRCPLRPTRRPARRLAHRAQRRERRSSGGRSGPNGREGHRSRCDHLPRRSNLRRRSGDLVFALHLERNRFLPAHGELDVSASSFALAKRPSTSRAHARANHASTPTGSAGSSFEGTGSG